MNSRTKHFGVLDFIGAWAERDLLTHLNYSVTAHKCHKIFLKTYQVLYVNCLDFSCQILWLHSYLCCYFIRDWAYSSRWVPTTREERWCMFENRLCNFSLIIRLIEGRKFHWLCFNSITFSHTSLWAVPYTPLASLILLNLCLPMPAAGEKPGPKVAPQERIHSSVLLVITKIKVYMI